MIRVNVEINKKTWRKKITNPTKLYTHRNKNISQETENIGHSFFGPNQIYGTDSERKFTANQSITIGISIN